MIRTYKFKLYETKRLRHLHDVVNISGIIWNHCIALHKRFFGIHGKHLHKFRLMNHITKLKKKSKYAFWKHVPSQSIQDVVERIDKSYQIFFKNVKSKRVGTPSFKKVKTYKSFTMKGVTGYKINGNELIFQKKKYKFWKSRQIDGKIKTLTLKRDSLGDFYMFIVIEKPDEVRVATGKTAGIDFGLKTFLTFNDGTLIDSPQFFKKFSDKLAKANRNLSSKKKGSNNRQKARKALARVHRKIVNTRRDWHHRTTTKLSKQFDTIFIEDLNIAAMKKLWGRKVSDLSFSEFVNILSYKTKVIKIDRFYPSSKTCSDCNYVLMTLSLNVREWNCPSCGIIHDRDINAAKNIQRVGISTLKGDTVRPTFVG